MMRFASMLSLSLFLLFPRAVQAAGAGKAGAASGSGRSVSVPVNIGAGPTLNTFTGALAEDQTWHYGLKIKLFAVIDKDLIRRFKHKVPAKYRKQVLKMEEVRYCPGPLLLVPDTLFISPRTGNTGIYGAAWRPFAVGVPIGGKSLQLRLEAGLLLSYAYIHYKREAGIEGGAGSTHFLRPGIDLGAELWVKFTDSFLVSMGWSSQFYVPQKLGSWGFPRSLGEDDFIWHVGQPAGMFHIRVPYTVGM